MGEAPYLTEFPGLFYTQGMSLSLSHGKTLEVGRFGFEQAQLPPLEQGPLNLAQWFGFPAEASGASRPLELEIGSGKGTFLVQQATLQPEVNYLGIEWARAFFRYAADRVRRHELENVRLLHAEAGMFVRCYIPDAGLRQVHIYFPDPWPKKRHQKRRLIQEPFLRELHRTLQPAGMIRIATDHSDYFAWMEDHASRVTDLFERLPFESPVSASQGELVGTNFERKYRREGRPFHGMILRKR